MMSSIKPTSSNVISLFIYDEVAVLEVCGATSCSFVIIEGISFGYQYSGSEDADDKLHRAFCLLFEETLKRLRSKGIHLPSIDI